MVKISCLTKQVTGTRSVSINILHECLSFTRCNCIEHQCWPWCWKINTSTLHYVHLKANNDKEMLTFSVAAYWYVSTVENVVSTFVGTTCTKYWYMRLSAHANQFSVKLHQPTADRICSHLCSYYTVLLILNVN